MKIAIAADHKGVKVKQKIVALLGKLGHETVDFGTHSEQSCDYPDFARPAAEAVGRGECQRGILVCNSGIGMSLVANKVHGVRGALCYDKWAAEMSRRHNDANVLCLGAEATPESEIEEVVKTWLTTEFEGGRHQRRVDKVMKIERE
jgi:ribose 5-phosphate isomerase B